MRILTMLQFASIIFFAAILAIAIAAFQFEHVSTYVSPVAKKELLLAFEDVWKSDDVAALHYAISTYRALKEKLPVTDENICTFVKKSSSKVDTLESQYHVAAIMKYVPACSSSQFLSNAGKKILETTQKNDIGVEDLYYIASTLPLISPNVTDTSFISKSLKNALKSNETLINLGYAFHISEILPKKEIEWLYDKIDGVISQADEVDSKYYQFEGGLSLTSLIVEGIYKLSETLNKRPPLKNIQLTKFLNYFLSRLSVSRPRGAFGLVQVLSKLNDNSFDSFISVDLLQEYVISKQKPTVGIRVSNLFGEPLFTDSTVVTVSLVSVQKKGASVSTVKKPFVAAANQITYTFNLGDLNLSPEFYKLTVEIGKDNKKNGKSIMNSEHNVDIKFTYAVKVENFQIGVLDSEQASTTELNKLEYPNKLKDALSIDLQQRLVFKFSLKDQDSGKPAKVQQAFVKLIHTVNKHEMTFVCLSDSNLNFKLFIDPSHSGNTHEFASGEYEVVLILGDVLLSSSVKWSVGKVSFKFGANKVEIENEEIYYYYRPKPEIKHLFKEPERRPPAIVSSIFTGLVLSPLLVLLVLWAKLGVNVKNFPFTPSALLFHSGLGSIFVLYAIFWLELNMFQILKYLLILGTITFLTGHKMLRSIALKRKK